LRVDLINAVLRLHAGVACRPYNVVIKTVSLRADLMGLM